MVLPAGECGNSVDSAGMGICVGLEDTSAVTLAGSSESSEFISVVELFPAEILLSLTPVVRRGDGLLAVSMLALTTLEVFVRPEVGSEGVTAEKEAGSSVETKDTVGADSGEGSAVTSSTEAW